MVANNLDGFRYSLIKICKECGADEECVNGLCEYCHDTFRNNHPDIDFCIDHDDDVFISRKSHAIYFFEDEDEYIKYREEYFKQECLIWVDDEMQKLIVAL